MVRTVRSAWALITAGVGLLALAGWLTFGAGTAGAETIKPKAKVATAIPSATQKMYIWNAKGGRQDVWQISLKMNGRSTVAYCIERGQSLGKGQDYGEAPWGAASKDKDLPKIQWILQNSLPNVKSADVAKAAKVDVKGIDAARLDQLTYTATQAAIWKLSDGLVLGKRPAKPAAKGPEVPGPKEYAVIQKVHDYLLANAKPQPEPKPSLSVTPATLTGKAGEKIGPFTVSTNAGQIKVTASKGATVVDKDAKKVTVVKNGDQVWVKLDKAGSATVSFSGSAVVPTGRVFVHKGATAKWQKIILAGTLRKEVEDAVKVQATKIPPSKPASPSPSKSVPPSPSKTPSTPPSTTTTTPPVVTTTVPPTTVTETPPVETTTEAPKGGLPVTGTSIIPIAGVGGALLVGGAALLILARRRRFS